MVRASAPFRTSSFPFLGPRGVSRGGGRGRTQRPLTWRDVLNSPHDDPSAEVPTEDEIKTEVGRAKMLVSAKHHGWRDEEWLRAASDDPLSICDKPKVGNIPLEDYGNVELTYAGAACRLPLSITVMCLKNGRFPLTFDIVVSRVSALCEKTRGRPLERDDEKQHVWYLYRRYSLMDLQLTDGFKKLGQGSAMTPRQGSYLRSLVSRESEIADPVLWLTREKVRLGLPIPHLSYGGETIPDQFLPPVSKHEASNLIEALSRC